MKFFRKNLQQFCDWLHEINLLICLIFELSSDVVNLIWFGIELVDVVPVLIASYPHDGNVWILCYHKRILGHWFWWGKDALHWIRWRFIWLIDFKGRRVIFFKGFRERWATRHKVLTWSCTYGTWMMSRSFIWVV